MNNTINAFIKELSTKHISFLKEFIKYYKLNYNSIISINMFLALPVEYQLNIFYNFIIEQYNTGIYYDQYSIALFYVDVDKDRNAIKSIYKDTGKITNLFKQVFDLPEVSMIKAFSRAIMLVIDINELKF